VASTSPQPSQAESVEFRRPSALRGRLGWHLGAALRVAAIFLACASGTLAQLVVLRVAPRHWARIPRFMSRSVAYFTGLRIAVYGQPAADPVLFASNHISWLDIAALGASTDATFIAKKEVGSWGFAATLARAYRCVFVDRERRSSSGDQRREIAERLAGGDSIVLFAEGTSGDGTTIKPFKSALFSAVESVPDMTVQPVTVSYTHINGMPLSRAQRPLIAWFGDMELTSHIWQVLRLGRIRTVLQFHEPITYNAFGSRKALAQHCQQVVANGLQAANTGRLSCAERERSHLET